MIIIMKMVSSKVQKTGNHFVFLFYSHCKLLPTISKEHRSLIVY